MAADEEIEAVVGQESSRNVGAKRDAHAPLGRRAPILRLHIHDHTSFLLNLTGPLFLCVLNTTCVQDLTCLIVTQRLGPTARDSQG